VSTNSGQARVGGTIDLAQPKVFTDVSGELSAMLPCRPCRLIAPRFAGRRIASGRMSLDLQYKLDKSQLLGENKIVLEQLTLGERVKSPTAMDLPLDLAIALLTDSSGKIDLSVGTGTGQCGQPAVRIRAPEYGKRYAPCSPISSPRLSAPSRPCSERAPKKWTVSPSRRDARYWRRRNAKSSCAW